VGVDAMTWSKRTIYWTEEDTKTVFISVPFTWNLPDAYSTCAWFRQAGYTVEVGGPAVDLMPHYLNDVADGIGGQFKPLPLRFHNPDATFTSRGCPNRCSFCAVPRIEGDLRELIEWEPKPIVCDNNLLACSRKHFDTVIDRLKPLKGVDFNQGLDTRLLSDYHINRLKELRLKVVRLAWDNTQSETYVMKAIEQLLKAGFGHRRIQVYVLFGVQDTPDDVLYRLQTLKGLGIRPNPQRYNPLNTLKRDSYVAPNWTDRELRRYMRYWARQNWLEHVPFEEYR